jgi:hypothetical protein
MVFTKLYRTFCISSRWEAMCDFCFEAVFKANSCFGYSYLLKLLV